MRDTVIPMSDLNATIYLNVYAGISPQSVQQLMGICTQFVANNKPETLYFALSSNGGEVAAGFTLYNFLVSLPVKIAMHNMGTVDSIAAVIFLAADLDNRFASPHSSFLLHGVNMNVQGPQSFSHSFLKERLDSVEADESRIAEVIAEKTSFSVQQLKDYQKQGKTLTPSVAMEHGLVSQIEDLSIPKDAPLLNFNF